MGMRNPDVISTNPGTIQKRERIEAENQAMNAREEKASTDKFKVFPRGGGLDSWRILRLADNYTIPYAFESRASAIIFIESGQAI